MMEGKEEKRKGDDLQAAMNWCKDEIEDTDTARSSTDRGRERAVELGQSVDRRRARVDRQWIGESE